MMFGAPGWFWLLAAIAIPVAVHLWNRRSGKPLLMGTFRFLPDRSFAKAGRLELHEVPLLILRISIIVILVLLLAGLFFPKEREKIETVKITETTGESSELFTEVGILELKIPGDRIDEIGWWRIFEQAEYDYGPDFIIASGGTGLNRFTGKRPQLNAVVEWADEAGPSEQVTEDAVAIEWALTVREKLESNRKQGFRFAAEMWNTEFLEDTLAGNLLATLRVGDEEFFLMEIERATEKTDILSPGPVTGVRITVNIFDESQTAPNARLRTAVNRVPVIWPDPENDQYLFLNAEPEGELAAWFYSAAAHHLFRLAAGSGRTEFPALAGEHRYPMELSEAVRSGLKERDSAVTWLFLLLLIFWAAERKLAPQKEM